MKKYLLLLALLTPAIIVTAQNVGIGTAVPLYKLDVNGRMRVKTGTLNNIFTSSGIWYDDYRDGSDRIFAGMMDSIRWGLYGGGVGGTGWDLNFNAKTGFVGMGRIATSYRLELASDNGLNASFYKGGVFAGNIVSTDTTLNIASGYGISFCSPNPCPSKDLILQPPASIFSIAGNVGILTNFPKARLHVNGGVMVGSGEPASGYLLNVNGKMICTEARVQLNSAWPDYVFASDYKLPTISEMERYIRINKHLPNMPSAKEVEKEKGFDVGDMQKRMLEKIEELALYVIELKNENESMKKRLEALEKKQLPY